MSSIEYWRPHVDILTYEDTLIHYSAVLYLSSSGQDFTGGSFNRIDYTGGPYQISGYSSEGPCQTSEYSSEGPCHRNCAFNNVFHPSKNSLGMSWEYSHLLPFTFNVILKKSKYMILPCMYDTRLVGKLKILLIWPFF